MENAEAMETTMQGFYNNDDSVKNYDQSQCNYDHNSEQGSEELPASKYLDEFYNFRDANTFIQHFLQDISMSGHPDDIQTTEAIFQQLDIMVREQVDSEIEVFKENINKILTDQQLYFKQAFGLQDDIATNEAAMHVVPNSRQEDEIVSVSDDSRNTVDQTDSGDSDETVDRLQWYERIVESPPENESVLKCLVRMLVADAAITAALRRKEYAS